MKDYPLSNLVADSKAKLTKFGVPIPPADPAAVARMQKDEADAASSRPGLIGKTTGFLRSKPDISSAAHAVAPTMTPASESGDETLSFGPTQTPAGMSVGGSGNTATVETITPGSANSISGSAPASDPAPAADPAPVDPTVAPGSTPAAPADKSQESTSKKKKGIHKVLPF